VSGRKVEVGKSNMCLISVYSKTKKGKDEVLPGCIAGLK
jgi:hypothetical protein